MKIQICAADWRAPFEPESRGLLHSTSTSDSWRPFNASSTRRPSDSLLDTFRNAVGAPSLSSRSQRDVNGFIATRQRLAIIAFARVYFDATNAIARYIAEKWKRRAIVAARKAEDYFARRLPPSWRPFNVSIPLDSPDSSSFVENVPEGCASDDETRG